MAKEFSKKDQELIDKLNFNPLSYDYSTLEEIKTNPRKLTRQERTQYESMIPIDGEHFYSYVSPFPDKVSKKIKLDDHQKQLVERIKTGETQALTELYRTRYSTTFIGDALSREVMEQYVLNGGSVLDITTSIRDDKPLVPFDMGNLISGFMLRALTKEGLEIRLKKGGDGFIHDILEWETLDSLSQEAVNEGVAKGVNISDFSPKQIRAVPQEAINECAKHGGYLACFDTEKLLQIPMENLLEGMKQGTLFGLYNENLEQLNIPQSAFNKYAELNPVDNVERLPTSIRANLPLEIINEYVKTSGRNVSRIFGNLTEEQIQQIPQSIFNERAKAGNDLEGFSPSYFMNMDKETFDSIPNPYVKDDCIANGAPLNCLSESSYRYYRLHTNTLQHRFANGYDMGDFQVEYTQEMLNSRAFNGGNLHLASSKDIAKIPQNCIDSYIAKGGNLSELSPQQIANISPAALDAYAATGKTLNGLSTEQIDNLSPDVVIQRALVGGSLYGLNSDQLALIPQDAINTYVSKTHDLGAILQSQIDQLPPDIIEPLIKEGIYNPQAQQPVNQQTQQTEQFIPNFSQEEQIQGSREDLLNYVLNGGDLNNLTAFQFESIAQDYYEIKASLQNGQHHYPQLMEEEEEQNSQSHEEEMSMSRT